MPEKGFCFRESFLLKFKTRVKVNLGRSHAFVPKPQSEDRTINARLKQSHRGAVPKNARRDTFVFEGRTVLTWRAYFYGTKSPHKFRASATGRTRLMSMNDYAVKTCSHWKASLDAINLDSVHTSPRSGPGVDRISLSANAGRRRHHPAFWR